MLQCVVDVIYWAGKPNYAALWQFTCLDQSVVAFCVLTTDCLSSVYWHWRCLCYTVVTARPAVTWRVRELGILCHVLLEWVSVLLLTDGDDWHILHFLCVILETLLESNCEDNKSCLCWPTERIMMEIWHWQQLCALHLAVSFNISLFYIYNYFCTSFVIELY